MIATGRRKELVDEISDEIEARVRDVAQTCDVQQRGSIDALREAVLKQFGRVDIFF